jgi:RNA methyltransferase, TrmH family
VRAALAAGVVPVDAFMDADRPDSELAGELRAAGCEPTEVAARALAASSSLAHPARCIAVVPVEGLPRLGENDPAAEVGLHLHAVADPGNVGALVRTAAALGPAHLVLAAGCADPLGPKSVRASMGALFRVPVIVPADAPPGRAVALDARGATPIGACALAPPIAFHLGAERDGLPSEVLMAADEIAAIPQAAGEDSLNVAAAGAIALYEVRRRALLGSGS